MSTGRQVDAASATSQKSVSNYLLDVIARFASRYPPEAVRRLFSSFASGGPGAGLLLLRLASAAILIDHAIGVLRSTFEFPGLLPQGVTLVLGLLLVAGFVTPVAAMLAAFDALLIGLAHPASARYWLVAVICAALALLGPGIWSIDAKLFGWRRVKIGDGDD